MSAIAEELLRRTPTQRRAQKRVERILDAADAVLAREGVIGTRSIAEAVLDGARDRGAGPLVRSVIDLQRRTDSLTRLRPSRPGRSPQAAAAAARRRAAKVNA